MGCNVSCTRLDIGNPKSLPLIVPNPDISGIGGLIGFSATAYLTLLIVCFCYAFGYVPDYSRNEIDRGVIAFLRRRLGFKPRKAWRATLHTAILMFSDQQLVTGIALLVSGYIQVACGLDPFHWQIVIYLAWFSSLTHLTTLTILRQYFHDNPAARFWRLALMLVMGIMLLVALIPTGHSLWFIDADSEPFEFPVSCYYQRIWAQGEQTKDSRITVYQISSMITSMLVLFVSYLTRIVKLYKGATALVKLWLRTKPGGVLKSEMQKLGRRAARRKGASFSLVLYLVLEILQVALRATFDLFESVLWEIFWLMFALAWGTSNLLHTRSHSNPAIADLENTWGFSQVFPIVLLALPILSIGENYYERRHSMEQSNEGSSEITEDVSQEGASPAPRRILFRIGEWSNEVPSIESNLSSPVALGLGAIRRTGTDLNNEETHLGVSRPRFNLASNPQARDEGGETPEPQVGAVSGGQTAEAQEAARDYYQFEWFWIMVFMLLLMTSEVIIRVLLYQGNLVTSWYIIVISTPLISVLTLCSSGVFVLLGRYHHAVYSFMAKYTHLKQKPQQTLLRWTIYLFSLAALGLIIYISLIF